MADRRDDAPPRHDAQRPRIYHNRVLSLWLVLLLVLAIPFSVTVLHGIPRTGTAPDFRLTTTGAAPTDNGSAQAWHLADRKGQTVILDFMAVRCLACDQLRDQVLRPLHAQHPDIPILGIDVWSGLGVAGESDAEIASELQHSGKEPWPHARDTANVGLAYNAVDLPRLVVIDPHGQIVLSRLGLPSLAAVETAVASAQAGTAAVRPVANLGLGGLVFLSALLSVVSPCSIGLLPAYLGLLLGRAAGEAGTSAGSNPSPANAVMRSGALRRSPWGVSPTRHAAQAGLATAAGILAFYLAIAVVLGCLALVGLGPWVRASLPRLSLLLGMALAVAGVAMMAALDWHRFVPAALRRRLHMAGPGGGSADAAAPAHVGQKAFAVFGLAYGAAAFGCTGPAFLPLMLVGFTRGAGYGGLLVVFYAATVTAMAVLASLLVATQRAATVARWGRHARALQRFAGALVGLSGLYVVWFAWTALH